MITEEFFLGSSTVNIEEKRILVKRDLRRDSQDHLSFSEGSTVDFVLGKSSFGSTAEEVFKL